MINTYWYFMHMNIRTDLISFLEQTGWTATELAKAASVPPPVITRLIKGTRSGLHTKTFEKIYPFLYGDKHPSRSNDEGES